MKNLSRNKSRLHRNRRVRAKISGTSKCPRISIFRSITGISAQAIDDDKGVTIASSNLSGAKVKNTMEGAKAVGKDLAKKCIEKKIKEAVFDRSGYKYHGKVKALAEGAREGGLKF